MEEFEHIGEGFDTDMREPMRRHANKTLRVMTDAGTNAEIELGEYGVHGVDDVRFRESSKAAHLTAYIRQKTGEHKVISSTVAIGVVAAGILAVRHRKK